MRAIISRLARQIGNGMPDGAVGAEKHPALLELEALSPSQYRVVACAVSVLWDEFVSQLGGPAGMRGCSSADVAEYVRELNRSAQHVLVNAAPEQAHYALAPKLMALYVEALGRQHLSEQDQKIAAAAANLVNRGNLVRRAARGSTGTHKAA